MITLLGRSPAIWSSSARTTGRLLVLVATAVACLIASPAAFAAPPSNFQTSLIVGDGLDNPSGFAFAPDGRIFILERGGTIKIYKDGHVLPTPFAVLPSETTGDRGLIGIAFDPDFGVTNHYVYFYYTGLDQLNHVVRYTADEDVGTEGPLEIFRTSDPSTLLHVGGSIGFGPDGKLYIAVGDNGNGSNAQDLTNPHGKILRINKDGSIPADNPFAGDPTKMGAIWAYGMRNPWRFQFDSATGRLYDGDVGDFSWEEINRIVKGGNYGWPLHEGPCTANCGGFIDPSYAYPHNGASSAVTEGPVYHGSMFPQEYQGALFFGDYAAGFIKYADLNADGDVSAVHTFDDQAGTVVDLKVAPDGSLYYLTIFPGALYRVTYSTTSHLPVASASADTTKGVDPLTVHFSSQGSQDPDGGQLSYHWTFGDGTESTDANPSKTYTEKGVYIAHLTVTSAGGQALAQPIVIQVGIPPTLTVAAPTEGQTYRAGDTIQWNAYARDAAGLDLNDANITTVVRLHHHTHFHPFLGPVSGRAGSFTIPTTGEPSADTSYEITVTATDSTGLSTSKTVNISPQKSQLTFDTDPAGLPLYLDSIPISTPYSVSGVQGFQRQLYAPTRAVAADGSPLQFAGWSDGKSIRHVITTPDADTTYIARYVPLEPFTATYYDNTTFSGAPVVTRQDPEINFDWGLSPDPSLPATNFSARWTQTQWFGAGRYTFTASADDGFRLYIDGKRVIDQWRGPNTAFTYTADLGEGNHQIMLEYVQWGGGAHVSLTWDAAQDQPTNTYKAEYWNAPPGAYAIPATAPDLVRQEDAVDHDWGAAGPGSGIGPQRFIARWTRTLSVAPGNYKFTATADDGVRLYVDGVRVIDAWTDQPPTTYTATLPLDGGPHNIVMEYYQNGGGAVAQVNYQRVGDLPADTDWHADFWNITDGVLPPAIPTRAADLSRDDRTLNFDWAEGSPGAGIGSTNFVARWTKTVTLSGGLYRFSGHRDDGIRVYLDGEPIVDQWAFGNDDYSVDKVVAAGAHDLRVDYFQAGGGDQASFSYDRLGDARPTDGGYSAEYFGNRDLAGTPVVTRTDQAIDFDWGGGAPADGVPGTNFSARWTKTVDVATASTYKFTVTADDGARLLVDGHTVLDKWTLEGATTYTVTYPLDAGAHQVVLEYFQAGGNAVAKFDYTVTSDQPPPPEPFTAQYFANTDLSGDPVLTRLDDAIDFDWGQRSPDPQVPATNFSARWTRTKNYTAGTYRFTVTGDDGIRVLLDGNLIIDGWHYQAPTTYSADVPLSDGNHTIVVEYFQWTGGAVAKYSETKLN